MDEAALLEKVKEVKRKAHFTYTFSRNIYLTKIANTETEIKPLFQEALQALDAMHSLYTSMKFNLRKEPLAQQIAMVKKWQLFMVCIETILAAKTKDQDLLEDDVLLPFAQEKAIAIYQEFQNNVKIYEYDTRA